MWPFGKRKISEKKALEKLVVGVINISNKDFFILLEELRLLWGEELIKLIKKDDASIAQLALAALAIELNYINSGNDKKTNERLAIQMGNVVDKYLMPILGSSGISVMGLYCDAASNTPETWKFEDKVPGILIMQWFGGMQYAYIKGHQFYDAKNDMMVLKEPLKKYLDHYLSRYPWAWKNISENFIIVPKDV